MIRNLKKDTQSRGAFRIEKAHIQGRIRVLIFSDQVFAALSIPCRVRNEFNLLFDPLMESVHNN